MLFLKLEILYNFHFPKSNYEICIDIIWKNLIYCLTKAIEKGEVK